MAPEDRKYWYLIQIKPNCFRIAERNLLRQNVETFAPLVTETKRGRTGFVERKILLFPGYIFVALDQGNERWRALNSTYGVSRIVKTANIPTPVPADLIASLRERCQPNGLLDPQDNPAPGSMVRVSNGPFADFVARVEQMAPDQRVWVLIDMMGRTTRIAVPKDGLTPI